MWKENGYVPDEEVFQGGIFDQVAESSLASNFKWGYLQNEILFSLLNQESQTYELERNPVELEAGDLVLVYLGAWRLALATGIEIGRRHVYFTGKNRSTFFVNKPNFRLAKNVQCPIPVLEKNDPQSEGFLEPLIKRHPTPFDLDSFTYQLNEPYWGVVDRTQRLQRIQDLSEVGFNEQTGELEHDYLYESSSGVPIILSDYHQKLGLHLAILAQIGLIKNSKIWIDWVDQHSDDNVEKGNIKTLLPRPRGLQEISELVSCIDCGQAAALLHVLGMAKFRSFDHFSFLDGIPKFSERINPLALSEPFARSTSGTHILSFDLDQVLEFCDQVLSADREPVGLEPDTTNSYFSWLRQAGMNTTNYDAVCIYTSPHYIDPPSARDAMKKVIQLFED